MRSDNWRRSWLCTVKSLLSRLCVCLPISWALSRKLIYPGGGEGTHPGGGVIFPSHTQSAVLQILPAEWKHSEVSRSTSLNAQRASALSAVFQRAETISCCWLFISLLSICRRTQQTAFFFLRLNKPFGCSTHPLIILFG